MPQISCVSIFLNNRKGFNKCLVDLPSMLSRIVAALVKDKTKTDVYCVPRIYICFTTIKCSQYTTIYYTSPVLK